MFEDTFERIGQFFQLSVVIAQQLPRDILNSRERIQHLIDNAGDWGPRLRKTFGSTPVETAAPQIPLPEATQIPQNLFVPAAEQLALARQRNSERGWGFTDEDFTKLGEAPAWPEGELCAVVLEVCLDTVKKTFEEAWECAKAVQPSSWRWPELKSDAKHLRLLSGIKHERGLRWRVVDLAANWDRKDGLRPMDVRNARTSPHCAILWAASYFPAWVQAMDGINVPYVWISGYEAAFSADRGWPRVPDLLWDRGDRRVRLNAGHRGSRDRHWAVPAFRES